MFKLIISFDSLSLGNFLARSQGIVTALTSEPALTVLADPWPAPYPSRTVLGTKFTDFETAMDAAVDRSKIAIDTRNAKRLALTKALRKLAPYFELVAETADDVTILDATGYGRRQANGSSPDPLPAPEVKLKHGEFSGLILVRATRGPGTASFETQTCTGDPAVEANWKFACVTTGGLRIEVAGLTPGQMYYIRVRAIGGNGPGAWSDVASLMAT